MPEVDDMELADGARLCLRSGFCCKKAPCGFGRAGADGGCVHLEGDGPGSYVCGIADEIVKDPTWRISPAFGSGCCMPLFNEDREKVLRRMRDAS